VVQVDVEVDDKHTQTDVMQILNIDGEQVVHNGDEQSTHQATIREVKENIEIFNIDAKVNIKEIEVKCVTEDISKEIINSQKNNEDICSKYSFKIACGKVIKSLKQQIHKDFTKDFKSVIASEVNMNVGCGINVQLDDGRFHGDFNIDVGLGDFKLVLLDDGWLRPCVDLVDDGRLIP